VTFESAEDFAVLDDKKKRSTELAQRLSIALIKQPQASDARYILQWQNEQLTLNDNSSAKPVSATVDFTSGSARHRSAFGGGHGQHLARAVKTRDNPLICDATAGFGRDAFVFASLGCQVVMLEQSIIVYELLADALERAKADSNTSNTAALMSVNHCDSTTLPDSWPHSSRPDVIYLDPMYPQGKRKAKKEIQLLRNLLHERHDDEALLLQAARDTAQRVVVKRPRKAPPIAGAQPSGQIESPNTRYDIYGT